MTGNLTPIIIKTFKNLLQLYIMTKKQTIEDYIYMGAERNHILLDVEFPSTPSKGKLTFYCNAFPFRETKLLQQRLFRIKTQSGLVV